MAFFPCNNNYCEPTVIYRTNASRTIDTGMKQIIGCCAYIQYSSGSRATYIFGIDGEELYSSESYFYLHVRYEEPDLVYYGDSSAIRATAIYGIK